MSCDFAILSLDKRISDAEADTLYGSLCDGDLSGVVPNPAIDAFYAELIAKHPEIDSVPEAQIDDPDLCPWSIAFDRSPGHLIIPCVWSHAEYVADLLSSLARKHELAFFSVSAQAILYPEDIPDPRRKPWWKFW